jgi:hypothetical protein
MNPDMIRSLHATGPDFSTLARDHFARKHSNEMVHMTITPM